MWNLMSKTIHQAKNVSAFKKCQYNICAMANEYEHVSS